MKRSVFALLLDSALQVPALASTESFVPAKNLGSEAKSLNVSIGVKRAASNVDNAVDAINPPVGDLKINQSLPTAQGELSSVVQQFQRSLNNLDQVLIDAKKTPQRPIILDLQNKHMAKDS